MSTEEAEAGSAATTRHRRSRRRPGPLMVFGAAFVLLLAAAVCVGIGNFRANTTLLPVISFYLSGAAVLLTIVAVLMPSGRTTREEPEAS